MVHAMGAASAIKRIYVMQRKRRHLRTGILAFAVIVVATALAAAWLRSHYTIPSVALESRNRTTAPGGPVASRHTIPSIAWESLIDVDAYEVWAIEPDLQSGGLDRYPFHGKASVTDPVTRAALNEALERTATESKGWTAQCFEPHHGVRVTRAGVTTDFVICFKCLQVQVWQRGKQIAAFPTNDSAKPMFDQVLAHAGVKSDTTVP
jgi:hypothetical protein